MGAGLPGSVHDATARPCTDFYQNYGNYLGSGEWVWADSAYPIQDWVVAPFQA